MSTKEWSVLVGDALLMVEVEIPQRRVEAKTSTIWEPRSNGILQASSVFHAIKQINSYKNLKLQRFIIR
jgi:hypothetical protein